MTSRRARIKGIANIPVRRKNDVSTADIVVKPEPENTESSQPTPSQESKQTECNNVNNNNFVSQPLKTEILSQETKNSTSSSPSKSQKDSLPPENNCNRPETETIASSSKDSSSVIVTNGTDKENVVVPKPEPTFARRRVPKPAVNIQSTLRRTKPQDPTPKDSPPPTNNQNIENEKPGSHSNDGNNQILSPTRTEELPNAVSSSTKPSTMIDLHVKLPSDSERTLMSPLSPSKIVNRARIRPTPKLIRRNSVQGSASESEDDGRRSHNRIRNDSVCSTASHPSDSQVRENGTLSIRDKLNVSVKTHKLFRRSDQTRKVAEARREFYQKFGSQLPDKKRLTMMDLIYYNPVSNPMPQRNPKPSEDTNEVVEVIEPEDKVEEEQVDDPDAEKSDEEEDSNPVPQVKVGPNGEIILDEQSLVIEQTGTKKGREKLANSQVVNVDDLDRAYGIYKRPKRAKDWSAIETLRFYRTLNTVGTDFSLMLSLFPGRNRRELKMKFKKEERINRQLIDKALMNPLEFDLSELEKQLEEEEREIAAKKDAPKEKKPRPPREKKRKIATCLSGQMEEENVENTTKLPKVSKPKPIKKTNRYSVLTNGLNDILNSDSEDIDDVEPPNKISKIINAVRLSRATRKARAKTVNYKEMNDGSNSEPELTNIQDNNNTDEDQDEQTTITEEATQHSTPTPEETENHNNNIEENCNDQIDLENSSNDQNVIIEEIVNNNEDIEETVEDVSSDGNEVMEVTVNDDEDDEKENDEIEENTSREVDICPPPQADPSDLSTVEPGSLMILSNIGADGKPVYRVYMVAPGQQKVPVELSADIVKSLTSRIGSDEATTLDPVRSGFENEPILPTDQIVT